ncbi:zinc ribbon domain-containing protein [Clostridium akagii]|uniref:zinc ribbon domain-containing protein n=1 Tax=Clostridium akagii TaxID=91623 RepID=UPI0006914C42|nr:zinc ribbon domain-containing protein [Clostridium akagii]
MDFEKMKDSIENGAGDVFKRTEEFISTSKLNFKISDREQKIEDLYLKIGKKIYKKYDEKSPIEGYIIKDCKDIKRIQDEIEIIKNKILTLENKGLCSKCGNEIQKKDTFCPFCGLKQKK